MKERVIQFGETTHLIGVLTEAPEAAPGAPGVILLNSGLIHRVGPNRLYVELAREIAASGYPVLRMDFSGVGDSGARRDHLPYEKSSALEASEGMNQLQQILGLQHFVLVGICSGAEAALYIAHSDPRVVGIVPIEFYGYETPWYQLYSYRRRLLSLRSWRRLVSGRSEVLAFLRAKLRGGSGEARNTAPPTAGGATSLPIKQKRALVVENFRAIGERGVRICLVYGAGASYFNYRTLFRRPLEEFVAGGLIEVTYLGASDHTFTLRENQEQLRSTIKGWVCRNFETTAAEPNRDTNGSLGQSLENARADQDTAAPNSQKRRALSYWGAALSESSGPTPLVIDHLAVEHLPPGRRQLHRPLSDACARKLRRFAQDSEVRLDAVAQILWGSVLSRYSGENEVLFGFAFSDQTQADSEPRILPIRMSFSEGGSVRELLVHQCSAVEAQRRHLGVSLTELLDAAGAEGPAQLFESAVSRSRSDPGDQDEATDPGFGPWPALHVLIVGGTTLALDFVAARFSEASIGRLLGHLETHLEAILTGVEEPIQELPILTEQERKLILIEWNRTEVEYPHQSCLHELFEKQVEERPEQLAVACSGRELSYAELNRRSNRLAHRLAQAGVGPDVPVGLCVGRSLEMVMGLMGILKAGGAYVPLDPSYPEDRLSFLLKDSDARVLVTEKALGGKLESSAEQVWIGPGGEDLGRFDDANPGRRSGPEDLAYVIYTSGSTGRPKGAVLDHRGRVNNFTDFNRRYDVAPEDRLLAVSSLSFDMTAYDVFGTLAAGAALVLVEDDARVEPARWADLIARHQVTVWHSVPAMLDMLVEYVEKRPELHPRSLRLVLLGGDWIPVALPDRLRAMSPGAHVVSMGGATEVSMDSTIYDIGPVSSQWKSIPYGRPMANQLAYVLDRNLQPVPVGVAGELHLGGVGVGRGYWNRPRLSGQKFIANPFLDEPTQRLYKTGDLARFGEDGNLELLGRMDFQVKIRGYRIELGEIESVLRKHDSVKECVVLARKGERDHRLTAYVLLNPANADGRQAPQLKSFLEDWLPDYMIPADFVFLDRFPLTPNGKLDRKALPEAPTGRRADLPFTAPVTATERVVAAIWSEVLTIDRVGSSDRFLSLGGSSLLATEVMATVQDVFSVSTTLREVFELDLAGLAARLLALGRERGLDLDSIAEVYLEINQLSDDEVTTLLEQPNAP